MPSTQDRGAPPPGFPTAGIREPEPDAELLALWRRFLALIAAGRELHDEAFDPISREMAAIEGQLATMTASTPAGVAVLLRVGCLRAGDSAALQDRYLRGPTADDPPADLDPVLWRALVSIEGQTVIPDERCGSPVPQRLTARVPRRYRHVFRRQLRRDARQPVRST